jgi:hypothetical protein
LGSPGPAGFLIVLAVFSIPASSLGGVAKDPDKNQTIRSIRFIQTPIFPDTIATPIRWYLGLANRLHSNTRESVIRREILFHEGMRYDPLRERESERLLRERGFFESVQIQSTQTDSGYVTTIRTQDLWTLGVTFDAQKQADLSSITIGMLDSNLLGSGNGIHVSRTFSSDQKRALFSFDVPRLGRSRAAASGSYAESGNSFIRELSITHPIETWFDHWSWDASLYLVHGNQRFFTSGTESGSSRFVNQHYAATLGRYNGLRIQAGYGGGWIVEKSRPDGPSRTLEPGIAAPPTTEPMNFSGPLLFTGIVQRKFVTTRNLARYGGVEDVPLGWSTNIAAAPNVNHEQDPSHGFALRPAIDISLPIGGPDLIVAGELTGLVYARSNNTMGQQLIRGHLTAGWHPNPLSLTFAQIAFHGAVNQPRSARFYLGTDTGLRGYPSRSFEARQWIIGTLEQRVWSGIEFLWVGIGANAFVDVARPTMDGRFDDEPWRTGVGLGLMLGLRKSVQPPLRIEFALRTDRGERKPTLTITSDSFLKLLPEVTIPTIFRDLQGGLR